MAVMRGGSRITYAYPLSPQGYSSTPRIKLSRHARRRCRQRRITPRQIERAIENADTVELLESSRLQARWTTGSGKTLVVTCVEESDDQGPRYTIVTVWRED
jgi:hypothetical protein